MIYEEISETPRGYTPGAGAQFIHAQIAMLQRANAARRYLPPPLKANGSAAAAIVPPWRVDRKKQGTLNFYKITFALLRFNHHSPITLISALRLSTDGKVIGVLSSSYRGRPISPRHT
jgi:hypothetical protein